MSMLITKCSAQSTHKATRVKKGGQSIVNKHGHYFNFSGPQLIFYNF